MAISKSIVILGVVCIVATLVQCDSGYGSGGRKSTGGVGGIRGGGSGIVSDRFDDGFRGTGVGGGRGGSIGGGRGGSIGGGHGGGVGGGSIRGGDFDRRSEGGFVGTGSQGGHIGGGSGIGSGSRGSGIGGGHKNKGYSG